jgi:hypothetical protein
LLAITAYPTGIVLFIPSLPATDKDAGGLPVLQQASVPRQRLRSFSPSLPATDKDAGGLPVLQQASVPRQRLRSIPRESATQRIGIRLLLH